MFEKKATTIQQQITQLRDRGLTISNEAFAAHYLSHVSYYRLGEYWYAVQYDKEKHPNQYVKHYEFIRELINKFNGDVYQRTLFDEYEVIN